MGLPWWLGGKESACQCRRCRFNPWVRKIPWRRAWQPTPVFLPGESHGQRSWTGYSPWGHKESHNWAPTRTKAMYLTRQVWPSPISLDSFPAPFSQNLHHFGLSLYFPSSFLSQVPWTCCFLCPAHFFFKHLFIWLYQVLVVACGI